MLMVGNGLQTIRRENLIPVGYTRYDFESVLSVLVLIVCCERLVIIIFFLLTEVVGNDWRTI